MFNNKPMCWQMGTLLFLGLLTIISYIKNINAESIPCGDTYQATNGYKCYPCAPGYSVVSDCLRDEEQSRCKPCEEGRYMPTCDNATQCKKCDIVCPNSRHEVIENCTSLTNLKCQCIAGYYWKKLSNIPKDGHCAKHTQCQAGESVYIEGTTLVDTKCVSCIEGSTFSKFNSSSDVCLTCTNCSASLTLRKCIVTTDTICAHKTETPPNTKGDGLEALEITLIVIAICVVIAGVGVVIFIRRRRRNGSTETQNSTSHEGNGHATVPDRSALSSSQNLTANNVNVPNSRQSQSQQTHIPIDEVNTLSRNIALENETGDIRPTGETRDSYESNLDTPTVVHGLSNMVQSEAAPDCSTSMDAGPLSQRHGQFEPSSSDNHIDNETTAAGANNPSEAGLITLYPDCSDEPTVNGPVVDPDSETINDRVWHSINTFLCDNLKWDTFKMFYRWLIVFTIGESSLDTDVVVDHACQENDTVKERIHQLLKIWRQKKPKGIIKNIGQALEKCGHTVTKEKLYKVIKNQNGSVPGVNN